MSNDTVRISELLSENARFRAALEVAKRTIIEGGSGGVTCTVWVPYDVSPNETLVDYIDGALSGAR